MRLPSLVPGDVVAKPPRAQGLGGRAVERTRFVETNELSQALILGAGFRNASVQCLSILNHKAPTPNHPTRAFEHDVTKQNKKTSLTCLCLALF